MFMKNHFNNNILCEHSICNKMKQDNQSVNIEELFEQVDSWHICEMVYCSWTYCRSPEFWIDLQCLRQHLSTHVPHGITTDVQPGERRVAPEGV